MDSERQPYVGPRPFEKADREIFFGRDNETRELLSMIVAHPVVLLYAQSGAGKTSMLNAGLIPELEQEGLEVFQPARVCSTGVRPGGLDSIENIYTFNALTRWISDGQELAEISRLSLAQFLEGREHIKDEDGLPALRVIIFDQFEEIFTSHPEYREHRKAFFDQIRVALEGEPGRRPKSEGEQAQPKGDPLLRVLLVIREDYLAQIDSFAPLLPEKLRTRFRIERLREGAALQAVTGPLQKTHSRRTFAPGVAEKLVKDLMKVRVETSAGKTEVVMGEFVEPVQLQVVCRRLLEALPEDVTEITEEDLQDFGDVGHALMVFYEECLRKTVKRTGVKEASLRIWFDRTLITPAGTRGTVFIGQAENGAVPLSAVKVLEDQHIIRGEWRAGAKWYELTHDRLIEPIQESNRKWMAGRWETEQILERLEAKVAEWVRLGRGAGGLFDEIELLEVDRWVSSLGAEDRSSLTDLEALMSKSRAAIDQAKREKEDASERELKLAQAVAEEQKQRAEQQAMAARYWRWFAIIPLLIVLVIVIGVAAFLWWQDKSQLEDERASQLLAAQSAALLDDQPDLAMLLGIEAYNISKSVEAKSNLLRLLTYTSNISNVFNSQAGAINSLAVSPDGRRLAAACNDNEIILWNIGDGQQDGTRLEGHTDAVLSVAFCPDGKFLASGSRDFSVMLWSAESGNWVGKKLENGHIAEVNSVAFSPDGQTLASASDDKTVILWDVATQKKLRQLKRHGDTVTSVVFSPDGKMLASASKDPSVILWNSVTWQPIGKPIKHHGSWINSVAFSPDSKTLASGGDDNLVTLTNVSEGKLTVRRIVEQSGVTSVTFSPDGRQMASATRANGVTLYNILHDVVLAKLAHQRGVIKSIAFSPDSRRLITGDENQRITVWDLLARHPLVQPLPDYPEEHVTGMAFGKNGDLALSGWHNGVVLYDLDGNQLKSFTDKPSYSFAFCPNGKMLAWGLKDGAVLGYPDGAQTRIIDGGPRVTSIAFSPDSKKIAAGRFDGSIIICNVDSKQKEVELSSHKGPVWSVTFSRDGKFASGGSDRLICLWEVEGWKKLFDAPLSGHSSSVNSVAFSYDGKTLASGSNDNTVILWDVATGMRRGQLTDHSGAVTSIAFNPLKDRRTMATGSGDKSIILWDVYTDENGITLRKIGQWDIDGNVYSLAFSPDGNTLASSSNGSSTVLLWDVNFDSDSLIKRACDTVRLRRDLRPEEKRLYFGDEDYPSPCRKQPN